MKIGVHPVDLMVHMDAEHSAVTQAVGPLSKKHTIIGDTRDRACQPFWCPDDTMLGIMK
jgi:hypothetical protein